MNVVFLSNFYPRCKREYYLSRSRAGLASAADAHEYAIAQGLNDVVENFHIINLPSVFPFPHRYKDFFIKDETIRENGLTIQNVGSCNLVFYQFLSRYRHSKKALKRIINETNDIVYLIVYATNLAFLRAATELRSQYTKVRICLIVPDMPDDMATVKLEGFRRYITGAFFKSYEYYMSQFDSYVLLTRSMADKIGCKPGTYIVSEGVYNENDSNRDCTSKKNEKFTIFYSGMLYKKFGVMNLIDAVHQMNSQDVQLVLCGYGELISCIKSISESDNRIKYLGVISREEALKQQSQADLLVNPRIPDDNPFTKFSFPSKNLEYLASGTPALIYQLEGIPKEYYQYCYNLDKNHTDVQSLRHKIEIIMKEPYEERKKIAMSAREFVLKNKNPHKASEAIVQLLKSTI